ncbi:hypothetical protein A9976_25655 [Delftia sp. UME58]|nr:hypothetical protein [Delftia sp. UME58]
MLTRPPQPGIHGPVSTDTSPESIRLVKALQLRIVNQDMGGGNVVALGLPGTLREIVVQFRVSTGEAGAIMEAAIQK